MTPAQYKKALSTLGITIVGAAQYFGIGWRQAQRIASGDAPVPKLIAKVVALLLDGKIRKEDLL